MVEAARQAGEPWALNATPENIRALDSFFRKPNVPNPSKYREALLITMWGAFSFAQAAHVMETTEEGIHGLVKRAKKALAAMGRGSLDRNLTGSV
jgi:hypothetical protein